MEARSPKYRALYDEKSGVRFRRGRAEVTEEQAFLLAERRYVDGILIEEVPAKDWAKARRREQGAEDPSGDLTGDTGDTPIDTEPGPGDVPAEPPVRTSPDDPAPEPVPDPAAPAEPVVPEQPADEGRRRTARSK